MRTAFASASQWFRSEGVRLIDHAIDRFRSVGIRRLTVAINEASDDCRQWLKGHAGNFDLDMIVRSTPSSYATFRLVADKLVDAPAVITTVDTIMPVDQFKTFVASASRFPDDAVVLGVTAPCRRRKSVVGHIRHIERAYPPYRWKQRQSRDGRALLAAGQKACQSREGLRAPARLSRFAGCGGATGLWRRIALRLRHRPRARCRGRRRRGVRSSAREVRAMSTMAKTCRGIYREPDHSPDPASMTIAPSWTASAKR